MIQKATFGISRRTLLKTWMLAGPAINPVAAGQSPAPSLVWNSAGDGIYWLQAFNQEIAAGNAGRVVNSAVISSGKQALLIDPGAHFSQGQLLRKSIEQQLGLKVTAVVNTHAHPEHVLGNAAYSDLPIYSSATTAKLMAQRCQQCRKRLVSILGADTMRGSRIVLPNQILKSNQILKFGKLRLNCQVFEHAHSFGDLALWNRDAGVLFGGALAYCNQIPDMQESSLPSWLAALDFLEQLPLQWVIAVGAGTSEQTLGLTRQYLQQLSNVIQNAIESGLRSVQDINPAEFQNWPAAADFENRHALNLEHAWHELESIWWSQPVIGKQKPL
jgi:glyoxylase-like metal-dependent hydrolase (beta-lactamase superfamily II)